MFQVIKDPNAILDYRFDWSTWLDNDTIAASTWIAPDGITVQSENETTTTATVWLSGGTLSRFYEVVNRVTTAGGRTDDRTLVVYIQDK